MRLEKGITTMPFTAHHKALMKESFSIDNREHQQLLKDALIVFEIHLKQLKSQSYKLGLQLWVLI